MTTTISLANDLGKHKRTVQAWCVRLGFAKTGRDYLLDDEQVALIKMNVHDGPGRPIKCVCENGCFICRGTGITTKKWLDGFQPFQIERAKASVSTETKR